MSPERYQKFKDVLAKRQLDLSVIMENIHKPPNFAAMLRSCDAVGIHEVHAVTETGELRQHHHTASGANKWIKTQTYTDITPCVTQLKEKGFQIIAAGVTDDCVDFRKVDYTKPSAIIMGSELRGLSEQASKLADQHVTIPMMGQTVSLNVSVATALILYEAQNQREKAGSYQQSQISAEEQESLLFEWCYPDIADYCKKNSKITLHLMKMAI